MKKVKNLFKNSKTKFILGLILGIILTGGGVYAATIGNSKDVYYDNATSNLSSTNVQDALDELYQKLNKKVYFYGDTYRDGSSAFGHQSYLTTNFMDIVNNLGSKAFVGIDNNGNKSACIYRDNKVTCLKAGEKNWETNKAMLNTTTFPEATCDADSSVATCSDDSFACDALPYGYVYCSDNDVDLNCGVYADGRVKCDSGSPHLEI